MTDAIVEELERLSPQLHDYNLTDEERLAVAHRILELVEQLPGGAEALRELAHKAWEQARPSFH